MPARKKVVSNKKLLQKKILAGLRYKRGDKLKKYLDRVQQVCKLFNINQIFFCFLDKQ